MARQDPTQDSCKNVAIRILLIFSAIVAAFVYLLARLIGGRSK